MIAAALALLLTLTPAPVPRPADATEDLAGPFVMMWGEYRQLVDLRPDVSYVCLRFGGSGWCRDADGVTWIVERGIVYGFRVDPRGLTGDGWRQGDHGPDGPVRVRLVRPERLAAIPAEARD